MIRNLVELSEEINGRKHSYICPQDSPCEEVIAYCKSIVEYCEAKLAEAKAAEEAAKAKEEDLQSVPVDELNKPEDPEVKDVGCCSI